MCCRIQAAVYTLGQVVVPCSCLWRVAEAAEGGLSSTIWRFYYAPSISCQPGLPEPGSLCSETFRDGAPGSHALQPPGPLLQVHLPFQFGAVFLTLCGHSQQSYYYLLVTACCWFILRGKRNFVSKTPSCHLRHDGFWHPFFSVALRPQYRFIINEDATVILLLFIFITTPKLSC